MIGRVSLVGAGPGDPELLTIKAGNRLCAADLVLYDALISPEILELCRHAQRFPVGKRAGRKSIEQRTIEKLMIRAAQRGKRVVRLKAGDPFVLGRGGEEALALAEAGIACEVIPGLSSAIAAPELIGVPVTHRGLSSAFMVLSGHAASAYEPILSSLKPAAATLVVLMGVGQREAIARTLIASGWQPSTPAAAIAWASTPKQWSQTGTLQTLAAFDVPADAPAVLVIGAVVDVAAQLQPQAEKEQRHVHG